MDGFKKTSEKKFSFSENVKETHSELEMFSYQAVHAKRVFKVLLIIKLSSD